MKRSLIASALVASSLAFASSAQADIVGFGPDNAIDYGVQASPSAQSLLDISTHAAHHKRDAHQRFTITYNRYGDKPSDVSRPDEHTLDGEMGLSPR